MPVPSWIERLLLPKLSSIEGELKAVNSKIDTVGTRIDSLQNEFKTDGSRLDQKVDSLSEKMELSRDVERLKVEVAELRQRQR